MSETPPFISPPFISHIPFIYKIPSSTHVIYKKSPWKYYVTGWEHQQLPLITHILPNTTNQHVVPLAFNSSLYIPIFRRRFHIHYHFVNLLEKKCTCNSLPTICTHIYQATIIRYHYLSILFIRYIHQKYLYRIPLYILESFLITKPIVFSTPLGPP
jgi:hypothetical protein